MFAILIVSLSQTYSFSLVFPFCPESTHSKHEVSRSGLTDLKPHTVVKDSKHVHAASTRTTSGRKAVQTVANQPADVTSTKLPPACNGVRIRSTALEPHTDEPKLERAHARARVCVLSASWKLTKSSQQISLAAACAWS